MAAKQDGLLEQRLTLYARAGIGLFTLSWIAIGAIIYNYVPAQINKQVTENDRLSRIEQKLDQIDRDQKEFLNKLLLGILEKPTSGNREELNRKLSLVREIISAAKDQRIFIRPSQLAEIGDGLQKVSAGTSADQANVWRTYEQLVDYRSSLNAWAFETKIPTVKVGECIRIEAGVNGTVQGFRLIGCSQKLDWGTWTDVVFEDSVIIYEGGPLKLENVYFVNCQFRITQSVAGRVFGQAILASGHSATGVFPS